MDYENLQLQITALQNQINNLPIQNKQKFSNTTINTTETVVQRGGMQSAEFSAGATGWRFDADGNLEANSGHFRGDVTGASGTFSGVLTGGSLNIPDITSAPSFHADNIGNTWWGATTLGASVASILNTGVVDFVSGNIAGWDLSTTALSTGAFDTLNTMYFGASGLSLSNVFKVTSAGALTALSGVIGGFTLGATEMYGGIIKTAATVSAGNNGVIMDSAGLRGYDSVLGKVFDIHTDGSAPEFAFGNISNSIFEINTNAILRTSATVGDGSASSAGILINDTGLYATEANQTLANANVKILIDGSAVIKMNVKGGQTDFATGTGYFLGLSGGDYKFSVGSDTSYLRWNGTQMILKGSFDVGTSGLINNAVYTVANLPVSPTPVGFEVPSANEAVTTPISIIDSYSESNKNGDYTVYNNTYNKVLGQAFTGTGKVLDSVKFFLFKYGSPTGNAVVKIYAETHATAFGTDSIGTGSALAISDTFDVATLNGTSIGITFTFTGANKITLTNATHYIITLEYAGGDGSNVILLAYDNSSPTHSGNSCNFGNNTWNTVGYTNKDLCFYVYGTPIPFTDPANIYASDNTYATLAATSGILTVEVSKDAGANWQTPKTVTFTGSDSLQVVGSGDTELFGSSFTRADLVDANFRIRLSQGNISQVYKNFGFSTGTDILTGINISIEGNYNSPTLSLDLLEVKILFGSSILPVQMGSVAFASNGRKVGETAGNGTGTPVYYDSISWRRTGDDTTVLA